MPLFALRKTLDNSIVRIRVFDVAPPVLSASKGVQWQPYTLPTPPAPTPEQVAHRAAVAQFQSDKTAVLAYNKLTALSNMTPAQIQTWVDNNVTNLATAQDAIKTLAIGISVLIRRERLNILG